MVFRGLALLFAGVCAVLQAAPAEAFRAPAAGQPPITAKFLQEAALHPLDPAVARACIAAASPAHTLHAFAGMNDALAAASRASGGKTLEVGRILPTAVTGSELFTAAPIVVDGFFHHAAAITSVDALQLGIEADLLHLRPDEEIFVIDLEAGRAHGPIYAPRTPEGFAWLPMVGGDTAVIVVRSVRPDAPRIAVVAISHGYIRIADELAKDAAGLKASPCNNHIACETDPEIQFLSSGIGRYSYNRGFGTNLCSGMLINAPFTAQLEPYFLTANHCVRTQADIETVQVWWDYRAATCAGTGVPSLGSLPTSLGSALLATSSTYDHTLAELQSVPSGPFGRAYLGWETAPPVVGDPLIGIHHPGGTAMRISYGDVTVVAQNATIGSTFYEDQIRVAWYDGVTEGGSSGSPILLDDGDYPILGVLSNGPVHVCPEDPVRNWDRYGPFHLFFPQIEVFLIGDEDPGPFRPEDINKDGRVDAIDLQLVINAALSIDIGPHNADVNNDGRIDAIDVQLVINAALTER